MVNNEEGAKIVIGDKKMETDSGVCTSPKKGENEKSIIDFTYVVKEIVHGISARATVFSLQGREGFFDSKVIGHDIVKLEGDREPVIRIENENGDISCELSDEAVPEFYLKLRSPGLVKAFEIGQKYKLSISPI